MLDWLTQRMLSSFVLILPTLCSPNEDFGRLNKRTVVYLRTIFQGCEYMIWATTRWKVLRKCSPSGLFDCPKSSFGEHKLVTKDHSIQRKSTHARHLLDYTSLISQPHFASACCTDSTNQSKRVEAWTFSHVVRALLAHDVTQAPLSVLLAIEAPFSRACWILAVAHPLPTK